MIFASGRTSWRLNCSICRLRPVSRGDIYPAGGDNVIATVEKQYATEAVLQTLLADDPDLLADDQTRAARLDGGWCCPTRPRRDHRRRHFAAREQVRLIAMRVG